MNWFSALALGMALGLVTGLMLGFAVRGISVRPSAHLRELINRYGIRLSPVMRMPIRKTLRGRRRRAACERW